MSEKLFFSLSYTGKDSDRHEIDLYDVAQALMGFQRSIALTTHLVLNDEIITQAPSLKGATILALPPEEGSWKITAAITITATTLYAAGTAPKDTPLGHLMFSAYDYVVSETLGFHVDYDKSLAQQYVELQEEEINLPILPQYRFDSLAEKCVTPIKDMHRPIFGKGTANKAIVTASYLEEKQVIGHALDRGTFEFIHQTILSEEPEFIYGRVSSYNSNTYKGRIYVSSEGRPIPFKLSISAKSPESVELITNSLSASAQRATQKEEGYIYCKAYRNTSRSGALKSFNIVDVSDEEFER